MELNNILKIMELGTPIIAINRGFEKKKYRIFFMFEFRSRLSEKLFRKSSYWKW